MPEWTLPAPAKINLFLYVTGKREDGFHELVSLVTKVRFGDELTLRYEDSPGPDELTIEGLDLPVNDDNLVLRAARAYRERVGLPGRCHFHLLKRIPTGSGLGGGSSDAATALRLLQLASPLTLHEEALAEVAAQVGSDVPLFLWEGPVVMRGRGERIEPAGPAIADGLRGKSMLIFRPDFGVETPWAYGEIARRAAAGVHPWRTAEEAEIALRLWEENPAMDDKRLYYNHFEKPVEDKYVALAVLREKFSAAGLGSFHLTGSGSAGYLWSDDESNIQQARELLIDAFGENPFLVETEPL